MYRKFALAGAVLAAAVSLTSTAFAGANDYTFEPVKGEVKKGDDVVVSVRLKHKATDKPVRAGFDYFCFGDNPSGRDLPLPNGLPGHWTQKDGSCLRTLWHLPMKHDPMRSSALRL